MQVEMERCENPQERGEENVEPEQKDRAYLCDRCGVEMVERQCKVICPNCGSQYDCSDLSIYFD